MIFVYQFVSSGSDLDGETFDIVEPTRECADIRAAAHEKEIFSLATPERKAMTSHRFVAVYRTMKAYHQAQAWA